MGYRTPSLSPAEWRELFTRFAASGLTATAFCLQERISTSAFYRWRDILDAADCLERDESLSAPIPSSFVELGTLPCAPTDPVRVDLRVDLGHGMALHLVRG